MAGNSIVVPVLEEIFKSIYKKEDIKKEERSNGIANNQYKLCSL